MLTITSHLLRDHHESHAKDDVKLAVIKELLSQLADDHDDPKLKAKLLRVKALVDELECSKIVFA